MRKREREKKEEEKRAPQGGENKQAACYYLSKLAQWKMTCFKSVQNKIKPRTNGLSGRNDHLFFEDR